MGDEIVGHLRQRKLGDVEPLTGDETQEQVERPLELRQGDTEAGETRRILRTRPRIGLLDLQLRRHRRGR